MLSNKRTKELEKEIESLKKEVHSLGDLVFSLAKRLAKIESEKKPKYFGG